LIDPPVGETQGAMAHDHHDHDYRHDHGHGHGSGHHHHAPKDMGRACRLAPAEVV
jgi:hypothetical protein